MLLAALAVACSNTQTTASKSPAEPAAATASPSTAAASTAAESWVALVDAAKYRESWQAAAKPLQEAVSADDWSTAATKARAPLGKLLSRELRSAVYRTTVPGAPPGKYVILQFDAVFENKAHAVETITPMQTADGSWKVSGYFVK